MNTNIEFDEKAFNKDIEENEPIDINECFERLHNKDVTDLKLEYAIEYIIELIENYGEHFVKYDNDKQFVILEYCTDDEEMAHPFGCTPQEFENNLTVRLQMTCPTLVVQPLC
ncbi:hypothetical protein [Terasakiella pusilla]|uniref:hypothetical protein n=1 Tax=Terasakiella pusilla TaxID=64973 RepID=UPI000491929B|nr:hypothetical protein [Terasakiella pusilla]